ncbi:MAG: HlyD family efflux transporter periplasmic adaptor subunit, partial [Thermoguttaceae bacterium]
MTLSRCNPRYCLVLLVSIILFPAMAMAESQTNSIDITAPAGKKSADKKKDVAEKSHGDTEEASAGEEDDAKAEKECDAKGDAEKKTNTAKKSPPEENNAEKKDAKKPEAKPATCKVKRGKLKIEVDLDGLFEAKDTTEISLRSKAWSSSMKIEYAVEHGTRVKGGDVLVKLDLEAIDRAIDAMRKDQEAAELTLKQADQKVKMLEKTTAWSLENAERTRRIAGEDLKLFLDSELSLSKKSAEFSLKAAKANLENQQEELRQLEKMYKADDLTEETEEIILKRARHAVERAAFSLKMSEYMHERAMKYQIPRHEDSIKNSTRRTLLETDSAKFSLPIELKLQRLSLDKAKLAFERGEEKLGKLLADRKAMDITAPTSGIVYYGRAVRGSWSGSSASGMHPGDSLPSGSVFMTIVKARPMLIRTSVPEKELQNVRCGAKGTAKPTAFPDLKLPVIVEHVSGIPSSSNTYDSRVTVALDAEAEAIVPGMTCKLKITAYENKSALTVPKSALEA